MILAVDYGDRHIGLALGNPPETPVHRYGTLDQKQQNVEDEIAAITEKEGVKVVIVGVPIGLAGEETEQTFKSLRFIEDLRKKLHHDIEVEGFDETLTSAEADRIIRSEGGNQEDEHAEAARLMLSSYVQSSQ